MWGSKGVLSLHWVCLDRRLGLSGSCTPRQGPFPPIRCCPRPPPSSPWPWLSVTVALQTVWGQRLTQQPHIRHGSSPLCVHKCWMANHPKPRLLEFWPWIPSEMDPETWGRIIVATYEVHKKQNASFCAPHRKKMDLIKASIWSSNRFFVNIYTLIQKSTSTHLPWVAFASSRGTAYLSPSTADSHSPQPIRTKLPACHEERGMAEASRGFLKDANPHCVHL